MSHVRVQLTNSDDCALIDAADAPKVLAFGKWRKTDHGYAITTRRVKDRKISTYMHHVVRGRPRKGHVIDHINHNKLDNTRSNTRMVRKGINAWNRTAFTLMRGGCRGVRWVETGQFWEVHLCKSGRRYTFGRYRSFLDAKIATTICSALLYGRHTQFYGEPLVGKDFDEVCAQAAINFALLSERTRRRILKKIAKAVHPDSRELFRTLQKSVERGE